MVICNYRNAKRLSAFLMAVPSVMPVHSGMLSSHLFLSASSSPSLPCALQDCLGKPCRSCYMPVPFQFASFYCGQAIFVGSNGLPSSVSHLFVGDVVLYVMPRSFLRHLISMACILLSVSAVSVQDSQAYRYMDMIRERISLIFELSAIFLSFQMVLSLASAAVAWAILVSDI